LRIFYRRGAETQRKHNMETVGKSILKAEQLISAAKELRE
jgi:hypothetical protein